jgi:transcriptional regulator with XRE-family HTH domain
MKKTTRRGATKRGGRPKSDPGRLGWNGVAMRDRRELKGMTRTMLAAMLRVQFSTPATSSTLARWELGEATPTASQATAVSKALGCTRRALGTTTKK